VTVSRPLIGLDIGTSAVRAAEIRVGRSGSVLTRFGQVALPVGAVESGEVIDAPAVAAAIKRLWKDVGFKSRNVITAVAGPRVVARTAELPAMSDDDLRSSLAFQIHDLIPIPLEEAVIDHQILGPAGDADEERLRVLVVAAHRDLVRALLAAVEGAGLTVDRLDLVPLALVRSLRSVGYEELATSSVARAEAIVDIGAGVTNVIVHEHGIPSFIRSLPTGGRDLTDAVATDLGVEHDEAEILKRGAGVAVDLDPARQVVKAAVIPVLEEIRGSLDFWQAQAVDSQLRRVVLSGGGARAAELADRLQSLVGVDVETAHPFDRLDVHDAGLTAEQLNAAEGIAAVAVGLALSADALVTGRRRISLLPIEIAERRRDRRQVIAAGAGVAAFAALLLGLYGMRAGQVDRARDKAEVAEAHTAELNADIAELQDVESLQADLAARHDTVVAALAGDVSWPRLSQEVAAVMPNAVWLTSFTGTRGTPTAPGTVQFGAMGFDHTSTAHWLIRLGEMPALSGLWVPSSTKATTGDGPSIVTFSSTANLTPAAESSRALRFAGGAQ
jgi:type IV pilus assembly protein PilM